MFIDFHSHIFPDIVAEKAIPKLAAIINQTPSTDGTYHGLEKSMEEAGVDISVVLPPATSPRQFDSIVRFAHEINEKFYNNSSKGIFSLAGIHPDAPQYKEQLKQIKDMGLPGFKIHPDYQGVFFNDIRYKRILYTASELGLLVVTHAGFDIYSPNLVHCTTQMILEVVDEVQPKNLVLAHMGNNAFYDQVEEYLLGIDAYFDTAYTISQLEPNRLKRLIQGHGAHKILFGTDTPWSNQTEDVQTLTNLGLTSEELAMVSHKNALRLLHLQSPDES